MKKRVMCYALLWGVFLISCGQPGGKDQRVVSPDGTVAMQVYVADGHLSYTVAEKGTVNRYHAPICHSLILLEFSIRYMPNIDIVYPLQFSIS